MVKLKVTGPNSHDWMASKWTNLYDESCPTAFSESCFTGSGGGESQYTVELVASNEGKNIVCNKLRKLENLISYWHNNALWINFNYCQFLSE